MKDGRKPICKNREVNILLTYSTKKRKEVSKSWIRYLRDINKFRDFKAQSIKKIIEPQQKNNFSDSPLMLHWIYRYRSLREILLNLKFSKVYNMSTFETFQFRQPDIPVWWRHYGVIFWTPLSLLDTLIFPWVAFYINWYNDIFFENVL